MKNYKCFVALTMAATMVIGGAFTAMATETGDTPAQPTPGTGGSTGTGSYEGYVEETSVFSVLVPTDASATKGFNFFVDPNGLLAKTDYAHLTGVTAADFETGSTLFFEREPKAAADSNPAVVKYGKDSESITFINKSSYDVDVEVSASVTGADKITLGEAKNDATEPTIELAIVSGSNKQIIAADGGKLTGTIAGDKTNFKVQYKDGKYQYALVADDKVDDTAWKSYSFNLSGACSGTWTAEQAEIQPTVNLTWKVTDPKATPVAPTTTATSITAGGEAVEITIPDGITVEKIEKTKADGTYNELPAQYFKLEDIDGGKKLTVTASFKTQFGAGKKIKISFSEGDPIELDVQ